MIPVASSLYKDGIVYRQVNRIFQSQYDCLMGRSPYKVLAKQSFSQHNRSFIGIRRLGIYNEFHTHCDFTFHHHVYNVDNVMTSIIWEQPLAL